MNNQSEEDFQRTSLEQVKFFYPEFVINVSLNGINLSKLNSTDRYKLINQLKQNHFEKGLPDVDLSLPEGKTLHLEYKKPSGGTQSNEQKDIEQQLTKLGHSYTIIEDNDTLFKLIADNTSEMYRIKQFKEQTKDMVGDTLTKSYLFYPVGTKTDVVTSMLLDKYHL